MASNHASPSDQGNRRHVHEGPKNHFLTFGLSIVLTILAFVVVNAQMGRTFTLLFLVVLALIQAVFQLAFWMHVKDRGHFYSIVGIATGFGIALTGVAAVVYWIWW